MRRHFYTFFIAAGSSSTAFLIGTQCSSENFGQELKWWIPALRAHADSSGSGSTLVIPAQIPSIPSGPIETKPLDGRIEDIEFWKRPSRASEIMRYGYPGFDNLRTYEDFVISYDRRNRTAHWVMEHLTPERMIYNPEIDRSKCMFREDESIHQYFRSRNEDYKRSGYDRGHLAPAANHRRSQQAMDQTFLLTNISPQVGKGFNRDKWNELEKYIRHLGRENRNLYICTGPLYLPRKAEDGSLYVTYKLIGSNRIAVPTHFFKAVLIEKTKGHFGLEVYMMPNEAIPDEKPLKDFLVNLDTIEISAGFLIFDRLPRGLLKKINGQSTGSVLRMFG